MSEMDLQNLGPELSEAECGALEDFLPSDRVPDETMDIAMWDGFLTALAIGPDDVIPSSWLPRVWGGVEMEWETMEEAPYNTGDIDRLRNRILYGFQSDAVELEPVFQESSHAGESLYQFLQTGENQSRKMLLLR